MAMTPTQFVNQWTKVKFTSTNYERIDETYLQEFTDDIATVFGVEVPNVPLYDPAATYVAGYLVRYTPAGGQESFYYALRAGQLATPGPGNLADWKLVPGPVRPTELSQQISLVQAQGIENDQVVAGRTYLVEFGPEPGTGYMQTIALRGISNNSFDTEGTLEVNGKRTPVQDVDVFTGTWRVKGAVGYTDAQIDALLATKQDAGPVMGVVNGLEIPFATLADAINSGTSVIYLHADLEIGKATPTFSGTLYGNGHTVLLTSGGRLRLLRYAKLFDCLIDAQANAYLDVIGSGSPGSGSVPPVEECLEVRDSGISAPMRFAAATAYQGLVLRGNSYAASLLSGGGPVYLYDQAYLGTNTAAGFTLYDRRPGTAPASVFSYAARRYETAAKVQLNNVYTYGIPCTLALPGSSAGYTSSPTGFVITESGYYGLKGHAHMVFPNLEVYAEVFFYLNNDGAQRAGFNQITPRDLGGGLLLGTEQVATDLYLPAGTTVGLGYSDSSAGGVFPRSDAPANSSTMSIIRLS